MNLSNLDEKCQGCKAPGCLHRLSQIQILPLVNYVHLDRDTVTVGIELYRRKETAHSENPRVSEPVYLHEVSFRVHCVLGAGRVM